MVSELSALAKRKPVIEETTGRPFGPYQPSTENLHRFATNDDKSTIKAQRHTPKQYNSSLIVPILVLFPQLLRLALLTQNTSNLNLLKLETQLLMTISLFTDHEDEGLKTLMKVNQKVLTCSQLPNLVDLQKSFYLGTDQKLLVRRYNTLHNPSFLLQPQSLVLS